MTAKRKDLAGLPNWPRLLNREQAAAYCSLSPSAFDTHLRPIINEIYFGAAVRFDRKQLDKIVDTLSRCDGGLADPAKALEALND